ncbi:MAG: hypothetical protein A2428_15085 [Bdellovibrionales bacterium RIFOXYC1_FULL_54_43]|nr:MAG: hypothetical protein A2428_15085 [Bdellovibrionales bacterium RIFOXYC1_FULL_54_43]OFZ82281.1 MAG: hypothetical protein A2603_01180 [Bdellovibrionales bacterium RIFOXYD1_FULL_55_31]
MICSRFMNLAGLFVLLVTLTATTGCGKKGILDHVVVTPTENFQNVRVSLFFKSDVQLLLEGKVGVGEYGHVYMYPWTAGRPFEMGFELKSSVFHEPGYVNLKPTMYLPNGAPIGLPYAVVEVRGEQPVTPTFDLYGYVDVEHLSWLGMAGVFEISEGSDIPAGLTLTQVFLRDEAGVPTLFASVLGPAFNTDGSVKQRAGLALFANVKALALKTRAGEPNVLKPEKKIYVTGPIATDTPSKKADMVRLQREIIAEANRSAGR